MGLDTVELVIAIEKEFRIAIPDAEAEKLYTVGLLQDYVVAILRERGDTPNESEMWRRLSAIVVNQLGVRPDEVIRSARFIEDLRVD